MVGGLLQTSGNREKSFLGTSSQIGLKENRDYQGELLKGRWLGV